MLFSLEVLPAREGDCLLLHWGTALAPRLAVVDGGPKGTFKEQLGPRLETYRQRSGKPSATLEWVMVSHIDGDHITGINTLVEQIRSDAETGQAARWRLKRLWHNAFNDVLGDATDAYYSKLPAGVTADAEGEPPPTLAPVLASHLQAKQGLSEVVANHLAGDIAALLASHPQGRELRDDHRWLQDQGLTAMLNSPATNVAGKPTLLTSALTEAVDIGGLLVQVVGPMAAEIKQLQIEFDKYLKKSGLAVQAALAAYADESIPNLSSIVCLVRAGSGATAKTILFTGDARGDKVLAGLHAAGLLDVHGKMDVDILKVPHHGSDRNTAPEFFRALRARYYVLSGNGLYGNPDTGTLRWIAEARGKGDDYTLALTYRPEDQDETHKNYLAGQGKAFDPKRHSIVRALEQLRTEGYKFKLLAGGPQMLSLGTEKPIW